ERKLLGRMDCDHISGMKIGTYTTLFIGDVEKTVPLLFCFTGSKIQGNNAVPFVLFATIVLQSFLQYGAWMEHKVVSNRTERTWETGMQDTMTILDWLDW